MKIILAWFCAVTILGLVNLPVQASDCDKARAYFQQAIELDNNIHTLIEKEQLYKRAIEECQSFAEVHNNLADVYEKQEKFEEAIIEYKKAAELEPIAPYPYFGLGDIYYKTNRPEQAIEWYEKGLKYDPNDVITRKKIDQLKDVQKNEVIAAETIRGMLSTQRGLGGVISITFGEGLIPFDFDKYDIRKDAKPQINEIGKALQEILSWGSNKSAESRVLPILEIVGHTDVRGTNEYNMNLSMLRAKSVVNYLVKKFNIPKEVLLPKGKGEEAPLCTSDRSESCNALNRRVEIIKKVP